MKTFTALFAVDVPHYGVEVIEAENREEALRIAESLSADDICDEAEWSSAACSRLVSLEDDSSGEIVAEDVSLDEFFLHSGGDAALRLCEAAAQMRDALFLASEQFDQLEKLHADDTEFWEAKEAVTAALKAIDGGAL